ncbi:MAG: hypothetical protein U0168_29670 [Nannocystaceae bacterium]
MLSLDEPISLSGLSIFRDFNDRSLFYYLPESPQLTVTGGEPMFELLVYRRAAGAEGSLGGGFLAMTTDLKVSEGRLETVRGELSRRFGVEARLSALPVDSGTVRVSLLDSSSADEARSGGFVERIIAAGSPSLYGDERAVFSTTLSQDGATLLAAALRNGGATPVVMVYELSYTGLLPAYECKITIHFDQTYDYLRQRATFSSLMLQADVDKEMEELTKNGAIQISEIVYHTEDDSAKERHRQELIQLAKDLATWSFFSPGLRPGKVLPENQRDLFAPPPNFQQLLQRNQQAVQGAVQGTVAAPDGTPAAQAAAAPRTDRPSGSTAQATTDPPRTQQQVPPPPGDGAVGAWERAGRPHATWQLKQIQQRERQDIVFDLKQVAAAKRTISPQGQIRMLASATELTRRIKEVPLDTDFFKKIQGTVTTTAPLAELGVSSMTVELRYGHDGARFPKETAEVVLAQTGASGRFDWWLDERGTQELEYRVKLNHIPDAAIGAAAADEVTGWIKTTSRNLDIDPREVSRVLNLQIEAGAVDWTLVRQVQANVVYKDAGARIDASRIVKLEQGAPSQKLLVRPGTEQAVKVDATFFYADGSSELVGFGRNGSGVVLVNQPPSSVKTVTAILADPLSRYEKVTLQFARAGGDTDRSLELKGDLAKATWAFRPEGNARGYRYRVTYFVGGAVREQPWIDATADQLVIGDSADGVLTVNVTFLADLQAANMKALRIKLRYAGAPEWADPDFEKVFTARDAAAMASPLVWRVPMRKRNETTYEYSLQWIRNDNTHLDIGPVKSSSETLLIDPLTPEAAL